MIRSLLLAHLVAVAVAAPAETVVVGNSASCVSPPSVVISVTQLEKGIAHARVDVYEKVGQGEHPAWSGSTGDNGVVQIRLQSGEYRVFIDAGKDTGTVALNVTNNDAKTAVCELKFAPPRRSATEVLSDLATRAPNVSLREFRGIVTDESGAVIAGCRIKIYRKGAFDKIVGAPESFGIDKEREVGQFQFSLAEGEYVAFFDKAGFRERAIPFDIDDAGWDGLKVTMIVGGDSTPNPPPSIWPREK